MFFNPTISAHVQPMHGEPSDCYSDCHKDAFGCRPRSAEPTHPIERAIEWDAIDQWGKEGARIAKLRAEVARFDFSHGMEYLRRREGLSEKEAFMRQVQECARMPYPNDHLPEWDSVLDTAKFYGWAFVAMDCRLPQEDGKALQEAWERLKDL